MSREERVVGCLEVACLISNHGMSKACADERLNDEFNYRSPPLKPGVTVVNGKWILNLALVSMANTGGNRMFRKFLALSLALLLAVASFTACSGGGNEAQTPESASGSQTSPAEELSPTEFAEEPIKTNQPTENAPIEQAEELAPDDQVEEPAITEAPAEPSTKAAEQQTASQAQTAEPVSLPKAAETGKDLVVSVIDVGQADSILIQLPNSQSMLIDAGNNGDGDDVASFIRGKGINKIDYVLATHPHEDHIGGMDDVINGFDIGKVYMPRATTTTATFEDLLLAISSKGLKIDTAAAGVSILDSDGLSIKLLAPVGSGYDDLNNYSAVARLTYGSTSFLFQGDAEDVSESEMLYSGANVTADVLKVGHHGSDSSTTDEFLKKVSPKFAAISCGTDNQYSHPTQAVLDRLVGINTYRTDLNGTITFVSNGKEVRVSSQKSSDNVYAATNGSEADPPKPTESPASTEAPLQTEKPAPTVAPTPSPEPASESSDSIVYITKSGEKYHSDGCRYLKSSKIETTLSDAKSRGFTPCSVCNPPK
jgi:competence protein ComEC